ncbi:MAG: rhomboid family intramembrane serine protease [archaeon]
MNYNQRRAGIFGVIRGLFSLWSLTSWIIAINVIIFFLLLILQSIFGESIYNYLTLVPANILAGKYVWTLITHMFLHANVFHLIFNMFSLWFIGRVLEKIIGSKRFLWFYLLSGIFAGLVFVFFAGFFGNTLIGERLFGSANIAGVGASGALFGLLGILITLVPKMRVYLILGPFVAIILESILSATIDNVTLLNVLGILVNIYVIVSIFAIFSMNSRMRKLALPVEMYIWVLPLIAILPLLVIGLLFPLPIANTAHIGGLIAGLIYGYYLRTRYKNKVSLLGKYFR